MKKVLVITVGVFLGILLFAVSCSALVAGSVDSALDEPVGSTGDLSDDTGDSKAKEKYPSATTGEKNALRSAQNYVDIMAFSKRGLFDQLSSDYGDGYTKAEARFAVKHVDANWKREAVESAKNYQEIMPMSRDGLIDQLSSNYGDKFTKAQAEYAVNKVLQ